jgi:endonuclease/exonuclease/phosphatase (EEP) superfamily protein YafD
MNHVLTRSIAISGWVAARFVTLARIYLTLLGGWALAYFMLGDRWWWLFALSSVAICAFAPVPIVLGIGVAARRRDLLIASGVFLLLGAYLYGGTLLPRPQPASAAGPTLTVMSFNMFGFNQHPEAVVAAIRASQADVIGIQELSASAAELIQRDLAQIYPYQALDPQPSVLGMGTISRYPLDWLDESLPGHWVGEPQILRIDVHGRPVTLVNAHAIPLFAGPDFDQAMREREAQAHTIARFAADNPGALIVTGDFNTTDLSYAYQVITGALADSWREAGWGFGATFPGGNISIGGRDFSTPAWVTRIDYVFHSRDMIALSSRIGPWDGYSDHRPVIATLALTKDSGLGVPD